MQVYSAVAGTSRMHVCEGADLVPQSDQKEPKARSIFSLASGAVAGFGPEVSLDRSSAGSKSREGWLYCLVGCKQPRTLDCKRLSRPRYLFEALLAFEGFSRQVHESEERQPQIPHASRWQRSHGQSSSPQHFDEGRSDFCSKESCIDDSCTKGAVSAGPAV